ncbi:MAG: HPr(Ser) kinase/phosphatase [Eubacteriales bacterium]|nr:HPr(Ser) kinase/phosphatase [Eubacteriales bacterium]
MDSNKIKVSYIIEKQELKLINKGINVSNTFIQSSDLNRLGLFLTGFYEKFDHTRVQIIGEAEQTFLKTLDNSKKESRYKKLAELKIPCIIYSRNIIPDEKAIEIFTKNNIPILQSSNSTTEVIAELTRYLKVKLAPTIVSHGVLVDVYGEGIFITGESGIGKSEAALELIKRGHRLVADDAVVISKVSDVTLLGSSTDVTRGFIEVRGIGIIDVIRCYGTESVLEKQNINLIINLVEWNEKTQYDRLGEEIKEKEILGNKVDYYEIPIRPGRNIAIIVESAAVNHRSRKMGFNPIEKLEKRMIKRKKENSNEE